jgi:hypothetical protein
MKYGKIKKLTIIPSLAICLLGINQQAIATPYTLCGDGARPVCVSPYPSDLYPKVWQVPGKELSTHRDRDMTGGADPEQNIAWDGIGGTGNTFDYSGSREVNNEIDQDREVDALSNSNDALYHAVIDNMSGLLFSVDDDPNIYLEASAGGIGVWADQDISSPDGASSSDIDDMNPIFDTDGLEVWGLDGPGNDDANNYSLEDGPVGAPDPNGVAVWSFLGGVSTANWYADEIAEIVSVVTGFDIGRLVNLNLDAMMTFDSTNEIMFSVDPIAGLLDGGEIFVGFRGGVGSHFLSHGGHLWDTAFDVSGTFGLRSENINALEAISVVPTPGILSLLSLGTLILLFRRKLNAF